MREIAWLVVDGAGLLVGLLVTRALVGALVVVLSHDRWSDE